MKPLISSTILAFAACASSFAATAPEPIHATSASGAYLTLSGAYARASGTQNITVSGVDLGESNRGSVDFFGAELSGGAYFGESSIGMHQVELTTGLLGGSKAVDIIGNDTEFTYLAAPIVVGYNYNFKLGARTFFYVGPRAGAMILSQKVKVNSSGAESSDAAATYVVGAGVGFKHFFNDTIGIEIGYDYQKLGKPKFEHEFPSGSATSQLNNPDLHLVHVGCTFRF